MKSILIIFFPILKKSHTPRKWLLNQIAARIDLVTHLPGSKNSLTRLDTLSWFMLKLIFHLRNIFHVVLISCDRILIYYVLYGLDCALNIMPWILWILITHEYIFKLTNYVFIALDLWKVETKADLKKRFNSDLLLDFILDTCGHCCFNNNWYECGSLKCNVSWY